MWLTVMVDTHGTEIKKLDYCYSEDTTINVCRTCNRSKSAKTPSEWLPEMHKSEYCQRWLDICNEWGVSISNDDMITINKWLGVNE